MYKFFAGIFLFLILVTCSKNEKADNLYEINGNTMGTFYNVKFVCSEDKNLDEIKEDTDSLLLEINQQMSTYMEDSKISLFNNFKDTIWFPVSEEFAFVVKQAQIVSMQSTGSFDITVENLVNLWGFGPEIRSFEIPDKKELLDALENTGYDLIDVRTGTPSIRKKVIDACIDLSAIAKGFAVDEIAEYLDMIQIKNYMVEIGGEVRTKGTNQDEISWKIGIETPGSPSTLQKVISISDYSIATSGDYHNYYEEDGVRYSHTIDPRTGMPITHKLASVSVIHSSCILADAYATAINVLGPEAGYNFALEHNLPVYMIVRENNTFIEKSNSLFNQYVN